MLHLCLLSLLILSSCKEAPQLPEKSYILGSSDKQLLEIKTGGSAYKVNYLETKNKNNIKNQTIELQRAQGFDKYVYEGNNGEILVVFPNGFIIRKGEGFNFSVGFAKSPEQKITNLDGKYNYVEALYTQTGDTGYTSKFDSGTIIIENNNFIAKSAYLKPDIKGTIEAQENGTFRGVLEGSEKAFANFIVKVENDQKIVIGSLLYSGTEDESGLLFATSQTELKPGNYDGTYTLMAPQLEAAESVIVKGSTITEANKTTNVIYNSPHQGSIMAKDKSFQGLPTPYGIFFGFDAEIGLFAAVKE